MLVNINTLIEQLDIAECNNCRFGGTYCVDCKSIDAHRILEVLNDLSKIGECKDCKNADFIYGADVETCYCLQQSRTVCSEDFCPYWKEDI